ncbi:XrtA/PEP-CTERM system TPR-repeat protein PrsT [Thiohalorhabdus sp.]|uniref:XrtA/PEP-CTERM system TPR-repeat protein PrsT n=1 Tax=Thiohalorhabdus sp. TaxID=3094134 RepID=UPI002FC2C351
MPQWSVLAIKAAVVCAAGLLLLTLAGCEGQEGPTPLQRIQEAKAYRAEGENRAAAIELKNLLQQRADHAEARWLLGRTYLDLGNGEAAEKELRKALELGIPRREVAVDLARSLRLQGKPERLIEEVSVPQQWPNETRAHLLSLRGRAYLANGERGEAGKSLNRALEANPDSVEARLGLARKAAQEGRIKQAKDLLAEAREIAPDNPDSWSLAGDIARWEGNWPKAVRHYGQAINNGTSRNLDRLQRALGYLAMEEHQSAGQDLETLRQRGADGARFHFVVGLRQFRLGAMEEAASRFQEAANKREGYQVARYYLGATEYLLGNWNKAQRYLEGVRDQPRMGIAARRILAALHLKQGNPGKAERELDPVLERRPEDRLALNLAALSAMYQGDTARGLELYRRLAKLQPRAAEPQMRLGLAQLMHGERTEGMQSLTEAAELDSELRKPRLIAALAHLEADEFDKALQVAEKLKQTGAGEAISWNLKGLVYLGQDNPARAQKAFRKALKSKPGDTAAGLNLAQLYRKQGKPAEARSLYQQILNNKPGNLRASLALGRLEVEQGRLEDAKEVLGSALDKNPESAPARALLARLQRYSGHPQEALNTVSDQAGVLPNEPALLEQAGKAYLALEETGGAERAFRKLTEEIPEKALGYYLLGRAYAASKDFQAAEEAVDRALDFAPKSVDANLAKVRLLMARGEPEKAQSRLEDLEKVASMTPQAKALAGRLALSRGRATEAIGHLEEALEELPVSDWQLALTDGYWQMGKRGEARTLLREWLEQHPKDTAARFRLGIYQLRSAEEAAAKRAFRKVLENSPEHVGALNNHAWLLRDEDPHQGLELARRAHQLAPEHPGVKDTLAVLLNRQGQSRKAVRLLREVVDGAPDNLEARWHLAKALRQAGRNQEAKRLIRGLLDEGSAFSHRQEARAVLEKLEAE